MANKGRIAIDLIIEEDGCTIVPKRVEGFENNTDQENATYFHLLSYYLENTSKQYEERMKQKWIKKIKQKRRKDNE